MMFLKDCYPVCSYLLCAEHCKKPLDDYVAKYLPKVQVIHLPERSGLIRARLAGATKATAEVLIFLDSHTEANVNWLPPLLGKFTDHKLFTVFGSGGGDDKEDWFSSLLFDTYIMNCLFP
jgi:Glycosyltransferases, probably involved in cell wall biogenesis